MKTQLALVICLCSAAWLPLPAATILLDFESDSEVALWHDEGKTGLGQDKQLERADHFAASGGFSLRFRTPAWRPSNHAGQQRWPAFEGTPPIRDWSSFDRLVLEAVNASPATQKLGLFISDSKTPIRQGLAHLGEMPPFSHIQIVIPLEGSFSKQKVDPKDVRVLHFFTEDPPEELVLYLDRLVLLEPADDLPALPPAYLRDFAALQPPALDRFHGLLQQAGQRAQESAASAPNVARWISQALADGRARLSDAEVRVQQAEQSVLTLPRDLAAWEQELARLENHAALRMNFEKIRGSVQSPENPREDLVVGFASSMEKILPHGSSLPLATKRRIEVQLARNEKESFQALVIPFEQDLPKVEVRATDLRTPEGQRLAGGNIAIAPVGYVQTKATPPYGSSQIGWWPDPILGFLSSADIAQGVAQAFWVRVRAPKTQAPGLYQGQLQFLAEGAPLFVFDLAVRVYGFDLPDASPLPLAITFAPHDYASPETEKEQAEWRQSESYPVHAWKKHKAAWAQFLADYYITYDSLYEYSGWTPDFEILKSLKTAGRLGMFNLGYFDKFAENPQSTDAYLSKIRARYRQAQELGLRNQAYIYGCDENPAAVFPQVQRAAEAIKKAFPDLLVMTTTYDHSYGLDSVIKSVDAWCPLTPRFDPAKAAQARALGKQVWWYICCGPHHPHPNMFIEYPAIEGRLLMGALTAKYRPDGFLYYQISIWNSRRPIEKGPFTDWDPRSWTTYHGDGSWTCVGPDGTPLPTIRLENFRDGLEDYAYFRILEATVAKVESSSQPNVEQTRWLTQARLLLVVPPEVATSLTEYTHEAAALQRYRNRLAEAIESAGVEPAYPWPTPLKAP